MALLLRLPPSASWRASLLTFADLLTTSEFDQSRGKSGSSGPSTTSWPSQLSPLFKLQSAPLLKSCDRQRKLRNPRITPYLKVAMPPVSGAGLPEPNLVPLPLLSDAVYKVRSRGGSAVQVLVVLDAPELQSSVWNCTGRPRALGATTVAVTYKHTRNSVLDDPTASGRCCSASF
jgi:hypothetical protein